MIEKNWEDKKNQKDRTTQLQGKNRDQELLDTKNRDQHLLDTMNQDQELLDTKVA